MTRGASLNRFIFNVATQSPEITLSWEHDTYWWKTKEELMKLQWRNPYPDIFSYLEEIGVLK